MGQIYVLIRKQEEVAKCHFLLLSYLYLQIKAIAHKHITIQKVKYLYIKHFNFLIVKMLKC